MTAPRIALLLALCLAASGCGKKDETAPKQDDAPAREGAAAPGEGTAAPAAGSPLPWTPEGYDAMSPTCKKALACCEEVATSEGATSAEDYNLKCSGPALWKDEECETDRKARIALFEADGKPVPDACK